MAEDNEIFLIEPAIGQWRGALIDRDGIPIELHHYDTASPFKAGDIALARVTRVDKQLDMAFIKLPGGIGGALNFRRAKHLCTRDDSRGATISDCVQEGQLVRVQAVADASLIEAKNIPLTARPKIVGRYLVAELGKPRVNFSRDIGAKDKKRITEALAPLADHCAWLVRSRAGDIDSKHIFAEAQWLASAFQGKTNEPAISFQPSPAETCLMAMPDSLSDIIIEGGAALREIKKLLESRWPDLTDKISAYGDHDLMEERGVEEAIEEALADQIMLPSGGWISIHETPALTAIDVNMGGALSGRSAGEAQQLVNMEAALASAYHMRLQDMGGLIVIDFIDMKTKGAAAELIALMDDVLGEDSVPVRRTGLSQFGLMELSRKRSGLSLRERMTHQAGASMRASHEGLMLLRRAISVGNAPTPGILALEARQTTLTWLHDHPALLEELKTSTQREIHLQASNHPQAYILEVK